MKAKKEKGPAYKRTMRIVIVILTVAYVCGFYYILHFLAAYGTYSKRGFLFCVEQANMTVFTDPSVITQVDIKNIGIILALTVFALIFFRIKYKASHYLDVDDPYSALGSDHLMNASEKKKFDREYSDPINSDKIDGKKNMILSKDMRLMIDNQVTNYNANTLVIGGSGTGKSRYFVGPNILQANTNFIVTDPKGELLKKYGKFLENQGYRVFVYNISDMENSNHFNPFCYVRDEEDIATMVDIVLKNTIDTKDQKSQKDPFWDAAMGLLLTAISAYLWQTDGETKTWARVIELVRAGKSNDSGEMTQLDLIFEKLANDPNHKNDFCVTQYQDFLACGNGKTRDNVLITCTARLRHFDLPKIQALTAVDDMDFENFANEKRALFVIIPTYKDTFNFIVSLMYSQLFSTLYNFSELESEYCTQLRIPSTGEVLKVFRGKSADDISKTYKEACAYKDSLISLSVRNNKELDRFEIINRRKEVVAFRGNKEAAQKFINLIKTAEVERCTQRLPNHTRFLIDEFANLAPIAGFPQLISTMRSYEISVSIILQSLAQLKAMYENDWQTISGNCDTTIYLGGNESDTTKWLSQEIGGKKTARLLGESYQTANRDGSNSVSLSGVEVLSMSDLRQMKKDECLVVLKGLPMYKGKKYDIKNHPNYIEAEENYGKFVVKQDENTMRYLRRMNRNSIQLSDLTIKNINQAEKYFAKECINNTNSKTGKPMITNMDAIEAMKYSNDFRNQFARFVLDATGNENVSIEKMLEN